jgi:hypothetical protein
MKHPTSQQVQVVLDNFAKVLPIANGHQHLLDMGATTVYETKHTCDTLIVTTVYETKHTCDTPMCHGGWYASACYKQIKEKELEKIEKGIKARMVENPEVELSDDQKNPESYLCIGYGDGASLMARHLGFDENNDLDETQKLRNWADDNYNIWGNSNGYGMFSSRHAFKSEKRPNGAESLQDIVNHWTEVRDRLAALEAQTKEEVNNG